MYSQKGCEEAKTSIVGWLGQQAQLKESEKREVCGEEATSCASGATKVGMRWVGSGAPMELEATDAEGPEGGACLVLNTPAFQLQDPLSRRIWRKCNWSAARSLRPQCGCSAAAVWPLLR